ncbi:MAG: RNA 2'-phosphotransferase, partial [Myxococcales bacterium]|nr:RNA 2'-phosphotransferase [Myxococcales bacterium]
MDEKIRTAASKFLSYVLRHEPAAVDIALDSGGWVSVDVLLGACAKHGRPLSRAELEELVATSPKQRFALSEDGQRIRANQGHSTAVDLG